MLLAAAVLAALPRTLALTKADQTAVLLAFRDQMLKRPGYQWGLALKSWTCPTPAASSDNADGSCDPCGSKSWWGNFEHVACRGDSTETHDQLGGNGYVTNIHITDYNITGKVPAKELCALKHLKEFDVDGGQLTGTIPPELLTCFPQIDEIDLLSGTLPSELGNMAEVKWLRFSDNAGISGRLPTTLATISPHLVQFTMDETGMEGDLYSLSDASLINTGTANTRLCGMVPVGVRFAHGFNPYGTQLGLPCLEEVAGGWKDLTESL
eukprot:scaffold4.g4864.t1